MTFLENTYQRKSFWITTFILSVVLALLFFFGLRYLDPPVENGILIAFGSEVPGNSSNTPEEAQQSESTLEENPTQEIPVAQTAEELPSIEPEVEEVLVNETSEVVLKKEREQTPQEVTQPKEASEPAVTPQEVTQPKETSEPAVVPQEVTQPKEASEATKTALANILGAASASGPGIGNTENKANQGLSDGSLYANSFYGSDKGNPNGIGFGLAGRSLVGKGTVTPDCNEEGRVVVAITVDPSGKVIAADPGVKGTTNNAPCLLEPAAATAYLYQWAADSKAPAKQIGFVVINFKLGQ